jgi:hypothetical protein
VGDCRFSNGRAGRLSLNLNSSGVRTVPGPMRTLATEVMEEERETWRPPSEECRRASGPIRLSDRRNTEAFPPPELVPHMTLSWDDLALHSLTREEIFLLTLVDGRTNLATLFDVSAAPPDVFTSSFRRLLLLGFLTLSQPT